MEMAMEAPIQTKKVPSEYILRKYLLMLATLVATVTYGVGFNPPGGVWQDSIDNHLAGDPIVRTTNNLRYLVFFYCNAFALASSVLVIVLFLLLSIDLLEKKEVWIRIKPLRVLMVLDLLSFMGAYAAGSCRDMPTTVYTSVLMAAGVCIYLTVQVVLAWSSRISESPPLPTDQDKIKIQLEERLGKVLMLLATFALSITYVSGLNSPGGFWDNTGKGHHPGDAVLSEGHHKVRLATFFVCNTTAFMASLIVIMLLLGRKLHERTTVRSREMFGCIMAVLVGLVGAYAAGSCRETGTTAYVVLMVAAGLVCILLLVRSFFQQDEQSSAEIGRVLSAPPIAREDRNVQIQRSSANSLLLLLATFATAITYPAGLDPPGGVWQENGNSHLTGDPILLTTNAIRYRIFFYFNSVAFVSSLVTIILFVLRGYVLRLRAVKKVMMLELFGLSGAYAAGVYSDINTLIYGIALAGAVLVYVVIHVVFIPTKHADDDCYVEREKLRKKRKLLYLLVTLSTAMSYQAGINPPGGFWLQSDDQHKAGNPVFLYNHPSRYNAFFYSNSLSFMVSVATMILLANPDLYRPAIQSYALNVCTVTCLCCLISAYAAGSTQHLTTSIGIFLLLAVTFLILVVLLLKFSVRTVSFMMAEEEEPRISEEEAEIRKLYTKRKHLMLLGIMVAGVTYQSGLDPPGGVWQSDTAGHDAGGPAMQDNMKQRYFAFFYSNSTSFTASIIMLLLLLLQQQHGRRHKRLEQPLHIKVMHSVIMMNLLSLLVAYASGSSRDWKSTLSVAALVIIVLAYIVIKAMVSAFLHGCSGQPEGWDVVTMVPTQTEPAAPTDEDYEQINLGYAPDEDDVAQNLKDMDLLEQFRPPAEHIPDWWEDMRDSDDETLEPTDPKDDDYDF